MKDIVKDQSVHGVISTVVSSWRQSDAPDTQLFLETHPEYRHCRSIVVRLAYEEFCLRRESGEPVAASTFCERFPTVRNSLRKVIDVHELFSELDVDQELDEEDWPQVGDNFLGFELLDELGRGAIARVFLASQLSLGRRIVVVKLSPRGTDEADTQGKLNHPNIVPVYSCHATDDLPLSVVCMPYQGSATLLDLLDEIYGNSDSVEGSASGSGLTAQGPLPAFDRGSEVILRVGQNCLHPQFVEEYAGDTDYMQRLDEGSFVEGVVRLGLQMAESLAFTHRRGILHRDLKPSNVLLTPSGRPKLLDFNLSSDEEMDLTRVGGTLPYMPPEQVREVFLGDSTQPVDAQSDLYSLGVILYQLLTGSLPFGDLPHARNNIQEAADYLLQRQRMQLSRPLAEARPEIPRELTELVQACLSYEKEARPASSLDVAGRFREILERLQPPQPVAPRPAIGRPGKSMAIAAVLCLVVGGAIWQRARPAQPPPVAAPQSEPSGGEQWKSLANAVQFFEAREFEPAAYHFKKAANESAPHREICQSFAAFCYLKSRNVSEAIYAYEELRAMAPTADALNNLGYCQLLQGARAKSRATLEAAIATDPTHWKAHFNLATWYLRFTDGGEQCIAEFEKAIELVPQANPLLHFEAARAYASLAQNDKDKHKTKTLEVDTQRHLQQALKLGCPWEEVERHARYFGSFENLAWFQELREQCPVRKGLFPRMATPLVEPPLELLQALANAPHKAISPLTPAWMVGGQPLPHPSFPLAGD